MIGPVEREGAYPLRFAAYRAPDAVVPKEPEQVAVDLDGEIGTVGSRRVFELDDCIGPGNDQVDF